MTFRAGLTALIFLFANGKAFSQLSTNPPLAKSDTSAKNIKPPYVLKLKENSGIPLLKSGTELDSTLNLYEVHDPALRGPILYRNLGSFVSPSVAQWLSQPYTPGYSSGMFQNPLYELNDKNLSFFASKKRYSEIDFVQGSRREQLIRLVHGQNIRPNMGFSLQIQRYFTNGLIFNQVNFCNNMGAGFYYVAPKGLYSAAVKWYTNRSQIGENGGLRSDSAYQNTNQLPRNYPVNAPSAKSTTRYSGFTVSQEFRAMKLLHDTLKKFTQDGIFIQHQLNYYWRNRDFLDPKPIATYYNSFLTDSNEVYSYINSRELNNQLSLLFRKTGEGRTFTAQGGYALQQLHTERFFYPNYDLSNSGFFGNVSLEKADNYGIYIRSFFAGANLVDISAKKLLIKRYELRLGYLSQSNYTALLFDSPPQGQLHTASIQPALHNNQNTLEKLFVSVEALKIPLALSFESGTWSNFAYFDSIFSVRIAAKPVSYWQVSLIGSYRFGKLGLINKTYLHKNSDPALLQLPFLTQFNSLYVEGKIFKHALLVRVGVDARFHSAFKPYAYNTIYGTFYQQQRSTSIFYPMLDFFISMKVKSARLFFKLERMNAFWDNPKKYYYSPLYPTDGAAFRMGINWTFLD